MEKAEELGESEVFWGSGGSSWLMNIQHTDVGLLLAGFWHKRAYILRGCALWCAVGGSPCLI